MRIRIPFELLIMLENGNMKKAVVFIKPFGHITDNGWIPTNRPLIEINNL